MTAYSVSPFGLDCLGNCSGWLVSRYVWKRDPASRRRDGMTLVRQIAGSFVGDIYEPEQRREAERAAYDLCDRLNRRLAA